jgi:hypothetical protein
MTLIEEAEAIFKKPVSSYAPGSVERVFQYNEKCAYHEYGESPTIIKADPVESKKKKSIN